VSLFSALKKNSEFNRTNSQEGCTMSETPNQTIEVPVDIATSSNPLPAQSVQDEGQKPVVAGKEEPKTPAEKPSLRETIAKAAEKAQAEAGEKVKAAEAKEKAAKPAVTTPQNPKVAEESLAAPKVTGVTERPTDGQPERPKYEPPSRFHDVAKAEWAKAPEAVQSEVARVLKENEDGIAKYKASHERYEALRKFDDIAKSNNIDLKVSLEKINEMENLFARDPREGFKAVAAHFGYNANEVAAHILGQDPNQQVAEAHRTIEKLQAEIKTLTAEKEAPAQVQTFAQQVDEKEGAGHFEKLAPDIAELLESGVVSDLKAAYTMANMMFKRSGNSTASDANQSQPLIPAQPVSAQTTTAAPVQPNPAGQKSVTGAPGFGTKSTPAKSSDRPSIKDAILRAAARA
jgi:hypothetical protein